MKIGNTQSGFTLIELMITLVLSLLVSYGIAQILINSNRSSVTSDGLSQAQETGRFVMDFLAEHIRSAGLDAVDGSVSTAPFGAILDNLRPGGDELRIRTVPPAPLAGQSINTCTGVNTAFNGSQIIEHRFWIDANNNLMCQSFTDTGMALEAAPQALAGGIEALHVLLGYSDNSGASVTRYINISDVPDGAGTPGVKDWNNIKAIKIAILSRSIADFTTEQRASRYVLLDSPLYQFNDSASRQVFTSTHFLKNSK